MSSLGLVADLAPAALSFIGGQMNAKAQKETNEAIIADKQKDRQLQHDFANYGIQWKVSDAKNAGISPLYALGANTVSYAPSPLGITAPSPGAGIAAAGQDISRAMQATASQATRNDAYTKTVQALSVQKMGLENEILASSLARQRAQVGPAMPLPGNKALIDGQPATLLQTPMGAVVKPDDIKQKPDVVPETARLPLAGLRVRTNPHFADAEVLENRYGEWAGDTLGLLNIGADVMHTYWPRNAGGGYVNPVDIRSRGPRRTGRTRGRWD